MDIGEAVNIMRGGLIQVLILAAPVLLIAMGVGLIVSILQASTSIQEQTLSFVPKIVAIFVILILLGGWMFSTLGQYTVNLFSMIPEMR